MRTFDRHVTEAEKASAGGIATQLDNQLKSKARQIINTDQARGYNEAERAQLQKVNDGTPTENAMRQFGRFGVHSPMSLGLHLASAPGAALATGGASIPAQIAAALGATAAAHAAKGMTVKTVETLKQMLAARSPYAKGLPAAPPSPSQGFMRRQMVPSLIQGLR